MTRVSGPGPWRLCLPRIVLPHEVHLCPEVSQGGLVISQTSCQGWLLSRPVTRAHTHAPPHTHAGTLSACTRNKDKKTPLETAEQSLVYPGASTQSSWELSPHERAPEASAPLRHGPHLSARRPLGPVPGQSIHVRVQQAASWWPRPSLQARALLSHGQAGPRLPRSPLLPPPPLGKAAPGPPRQPVAPGGPRPAFLGLGAAVGTWPVQVAGPSGWGLGCRTAPHRPPPAEHSPPRSAALPRRLAVTGALRQPPPCLRHSAQGLAGAGGGNPPPTRNCLLEERGVREERTLSDPQTLLEPLLNFAPPPDPAPPQAPPIRCWRQQPHP